MGKPMDTARKVVGLALLAETEGNTEKAAKKADVHRSTVWRAVRAVAADPELQQLATVERKALGERCLSVAQLAMARVAETLPDASCRDAIGALDYLVKNGSLLTGEATAINEQRAGLTPEALDYLRGLVIAARERGEIDDLIRQNVAAGWPEAAEYLDKVM